MPEVLVRVVCVSGQVYTTSETETTESLLRRLDTLRASERKTASAVLSITLTLCLHCL